MVVSIPVGPAPEDEARTLDLLDALRAYEPGAREVVLVDDGHGRRWPAGVTVLENPRRGQGIPTLGGTTCATLTALRHAHASHPGDWVLRLDSDALVIGPVADAVEAAFRPDDGILGSCHRSPHGAARDVSAIRHEVARHARALWISRTPAKRPLVVRPADPHVRGVLRQALDAGYDPGEHCIAAGCAISAPLVRAAHDRGWLAKPRRWLHATLGDDMVLGAMARACGLQLRDLHAVFGVQHVGLPGTPDELLERGHAVVHAVKGAGEAEARATFRGGARVTKLLGINAVDHPSGAELGLLRLAQRLSAQGWEVALTSPSGDGPLAKAGYEHHKLDVGGLGSGEGARAVASWPKALLLARDVDVVYLNSTVCGRLLPALRGTHATTVLHVHDIVDRVPRHWARADVVLADSQAVADRLDGLDAHVVFCPVELDPPHVAAPWPVSVTDGGPVIGFIGRIEPRKGVLDLVRAAPLIRAARPDATIVVIGDDPYDMDPGYLAEVKAAPGVLHLPWVDEAGGVLRHLDVLVAPSRQEPFGTIISEAMAVGTPVVATNVGGLPEVVEDGVTGVLIEPDDPEALAAAVLRVLTERDAMSAAGIEAAKRFGADEYAARVARLITP